MNERRTLQDDQWKPETRTPKLTCVADVTGAVHELLDSVQSEVQEDDEDSAGCHVSEEDVGAGCSVELGVHSGVEAELSDVEDSGGGLSVVELEASVVKDDEEEAEVEVEVEDAEVGSEEGAGLSELAGAWVSVTGTAVGEAK
jgi:hypothetical protein